MVAPLPVVPAAALGVALPPELALFLQYVVNGLVMGSVLALAAVGLTLVYGILRIANFAHGDFLTFGAYLALYFSALLLLPATMLWAFLIAAGLILFVVLDRGVRRAGQRTILSRREGAGLFYVAGILLLLAVGARVDLPLTGAWAFLLVAAGLAVPLALRVVNVAPVATRRSLFLWMGIAAGIAAGIALLAHFLVPVQAGRAGLGLAGVLSLGLVVVAARAFVLLGGARDPLAGAVLGAVGLAAAFLFATRLLLGIALALAVVAAFAVIFDLAVWRRARRQRAGILTLIIISIGLAIALRHMVQFVWGTDNRAFPGTFQGSEGILGTDVLITSLEATIIAVALLLILALHLFLRYTRTGKAMRALSDNMELARVTGIDTERVVLYVWIIAASLAAVSGILLGMLTRVHPNVGWYQILPIFAAVILGGIGSAYGALLGGFTIGIAMETSEFLGVPTEYKLAVGFAILILVLIFRPTGILGGAQQR